MNEFFKGVRKHLGKLDNERLREQYSRVADELDFSEMIFRTTGDGYFVLDAEGSPRWSNPATERLLGMSLADMLPSLEIPVGKASKRTLSISYPEARLLEVQTIPMGGETLVKLADVTAERERTEEELRAGATEAVRKLAAGVAHEIGNPLNAIALNLQLLQRDPSDTEAIDLCLAQVKRLDGIVRDFLAALRPTRPNLLPGSVAEPLKNCLATFKQQFEERDISVTLEIPAALPSVALDAAQMEQVFFNLIKNALEAMKDGGRIDICLDADDNAVRVVIRDNGFGMDAEQLTHLFEPYRTSKAQGTGLGLMISARIVRDHGGDIAAESKPGEGTAFRITLPRIEKRVRALK